MLPRHFSSIRPRVHPDPLMFAVPGAWRFMGACGEPGQVPGIFFAPDGERARDRVVREAEATEICRTRCTVREQCLEWAIEQRERHGVWGGLGQDDLADLRRVAQEWGPDGVAGFLDARRHAGVGT